MGWVPRRERAVAALALLVVMVLAWVALLRMRAGMTTAAGHAMEMPSMTMSGTQPWSWVEVALLFLMWAVMMVAMMLPSAAPMILLVATVNHRRRERSGPAAPTAFFVAGYLLVWTGFSAGAALAQSGLHQAALLSPAMATTSPILGGLLLILAGVYQWLPAKSACLGRCRSPVGFLGSEWREGSAGALMMGLRHGLFCLGCCWALMTLLFVAGVMNIVWIAAIAGLVLIEKVAAAGPWIGRLAGLALALWGGWLMASAG